MDAALLLLLVWTMLIIVHLSTGTTVAAGIPCDLNRC